MNDDRDQFLARAREQRRGSASNRGYDGYWTRIFRPWFLQALVVEGFPPICGAALSGGPQTLDSACRLDGIMTFEGLHLDHEPPLTPLERHDRSVICNPLRIQLLCRSCHAAKTRREQQETTADYQM